MATGIETRATVDDLYRTEGRAELIDGKVVKLMACGDLPSDVGLNIAISLREFAAKTRRGIVKGDGQGYVVPELPSGRESFQPDASDHLGPRPKNRMRFIQGAPTFAVEVRSEGDYGPAAEREMADKRADYFLTGMLVVWDVDPIAQCVHVYRADQPKTPKTYGMRDTAEAEPAVPGWQMKVAEVFEESP